MKRKSDPYDMHQPGVKCMRNGGHVIGPGGPRDDKVNAKLSDGEYVLPADTVQTVGLDKLEALRRATHDSYQRNEMPARSGAGGMRRKPAVKMMAHGGPFSEDEQRHLLNPMGSRLDDLTDSIMSSFQSSATGPTQRYGARGSYTPTVSTGPQRRFNNSAAFAYNPATDTQPEANTFMGRKVKVGAGDDPEVAIRPLTGTQAGYQDRSNLTEPERQKLYGQVQSTLNGLGPLNMGSKRQLAGQLLGLQRDLTGDRATQLAAADRLASAAQDRNADRTDAASQFNAGLQDKALDRRGTARLAYSKLLAENDPNSLENQKKLLDIEALKADQKRAQENHEVGIRAKADSDINAQIDAYAKSAGIPREQAAIIVNEQQAAAGNNLQATSAGRAAENMFAQGLGKRANEGGGFFQDLVGGRGFGIFNDAQIPAEKQFGLSPNDFRDAGEVGGIRGGLRKAADFLPGVEMKPLRQIEYTGAVQPGMDKPHFTVEEDDPDYQALLRRKNTPKSGY